MEEIAFGKVAFAYIRGFCFSEVKNEDNMEGMRQDYFGKDLSGLSKKRLFLFDMDGTIYQENTVFDGTRDLLEWIRSRNGRYIFITNNSSKSVRDYVEKVQNMGLRAEEENFFTSVQATIRYLKENHDGARVYCQGTRSMVQELKQAGIRVTEEVEEGIDVVLVGFDMELTMAKLRNTCEILTCQDPVYLATNPDVCCPVSFGNTAGYVPDCGSMCYGIEKATGKRPKYIGKPEPTMIDIAREKYGYSAEETLVIGDRLYTDIASGVNAGVDTLCVLSGEATAEDIEKSTVKPTWTLRNVKEMLTALSGSGAPSA